MELSTFLENHSDWGQRMAQKCIMCRKSKKKSFASL